MAQIINIDLNEHLQDISYEKAMTRPDMAITAICNVFFEASKIDMSMNTAKRLIMLYRTIQYELDEYHQLFDQMTLLISDIEAGRTLGTYIGIIYEDCFGIFVQDSRRLLMTRDEFMPYNGNLDDTLTNDHFLDYLVGTANIEEDVDISDITFYNKRFFVKYFLSTILVSHQLKYVYDLVFSNLEYFTAGDLVPLLQGIELVHADLEVTYFQGFADAFKERDADSLENNLADICDIICNADNHFVHCTSKYNSMYDICQYIASFSAREQNKKIKLTVSADQLTRNIQLTKELFYMGIFGQNTVIDYDFRNIVCRPNAYSDGALIGWPIISEVSTNINEAKNNKRVFEDSLTEDNWTKDNWIDTRPRKVTTRYYWADLTGLEDTSYVWSSGLVFTNDLSMIEPTDEFMMEADFKKYTIRHARNIRHFTDKLIKQTESRSFSDISIQ